MRILLLMLAAASSALANPLTRLSVPEQEEVRQRIQRFYAGGDMDFRPPKFSALDGRPVAPNPSLREASPAITNPLARLGGAKNDPAFRHHWQKRFRSSTRAGIESGDEVESLVDSWLQRGEILYNPSALPATGQSRASAWSGDYWRTQWGGLSYRYAAGVRYPNYQAAIAAYAQPKAWLDLSASVTGDALAKAVALLSPAEKYDLAVGDAAFSLTQQQKAEGADALGPNGDVPYWYGVCDGWTAAALLTPAANAVVTSVGPAGTPITWYPHDIRALASLAWARGEYDSNFIGRRCETTNPSKYPNGRLSEPECFDNNPATFHLALANLLGKLGQPFAMDSRFDSEVWNQPVIEYGFNYFNPLDPTKQNADWTQVAVAYDDAFKVKDRFQKPLTRGALRNGKWDDSGVEKVVGVMATVAYLDESNPSQVANPSNVVTRVTYTYDLEMARDSGEWYPSGGEWHGNAHPDFLWMPRRGTAAYAQADANAPAFTLTAAAPAGLAASAASAARAGYPLCTVVQALAGASSGASYPCR